MTVAALSTAIQVRFGATYLIELTNDNNSATTLNTTRLEAACADAIGDFERITTITHDTDNSSHLAMLVKGVLYFLEYYKMRDSALVRERGKDWFLSCKGFKESVYWEPSTTSNLTVDREQSGSRTDMDRLRKVWPANRLGASNPSSTIDPNEV